MKPTSKPAAGRSKRPVLSVSNSDAAGVPGEPPEPLDVGEQAAASPPTRDARPARKEVGSFRDTPLMMLQANFTQPTSVALPKARELILTWAKEQHGILPDGALDGRPFDLDRPGDPLRVITPVGDPNAYWALRLNRVDQEVAGRIWTVEAHLASSGERAHFGFRMSVLSEGAHALKPPRFIKELEEAIGLEIDGFRLNGNPLNVRNEKEGAALIALIEDEKRSLPVVVFSQDVDGEIRSKAAASLAKMARGFAHVATVRHDVSYMITRRFGKAISTFNGAIRIYPTNFSEYGDPFSMPLYMKPRTDRVSDSRLNEILMSDVCHFSVIPFNTEALPRFSTLRKSQTRFEMNQASKAAAASTTNSSEQVQALQTQIAKFGELETLFNESLESAEESARAASAAADELRSENYRLRAHVESLMTALRDSGHEKPEVPIPESLEDLQDWAEQHYPNTITITNKAARLAAGSIFEDVPTVYKALQLMATEYRDSKMGVSGAYDRFEAGLRDLGLQITPAFANGSAHNSGSDAVLQYRGRKQVLDLHIKNGGNTRDPARCLRIYFFWSDEDNMCIVGALPEHIRTIMT